MATTKILEQTSDYDIVWEWAYSRSMVVCVRRKLATMENILPKILIQQKCTNQAKDMSSNAPISLGLREEWK